MRPAWKARRPARTASRMASAMAMGSLAPAMAVFISTPSQPSSMAMAASDAVPTPAPGAHAPRPPRLLQDDPDVVRVADAQAGPEGGRQGHHAGRPRVLQLLGRDGIVVGVGEH